MTLLNLLLKRIYEITDWEAIYSSAKKGRTNNLIRTIYSFTTGKNWVEMGMILR